MAGKTEHSVKYYLAGAGGRLTLLIPRCLIFFLCVSHALAPALCLYALPTCCAPNEIHFPTVQLFTCGWGWASEVLSVASGPLWS
jgi:hypothetical protein